MTRNPSKDGEDTDLFRQEVRDAVPLDQDKVAHWHKRLPPHPLRHPTVDEDEEHHDRYSESEIKTSDNLLFARPGLQKRVLRDLRRGRFEIERELDMHGLTVRHARPTLDEFFRDCHQRQIRCVRIIHGKGCRSEGGQPILKQRLNLWLRQRDDVLAFCSATSRDGGTGAAYVLLRSPRKRNR